MGARFGEPRFATLGIDQCFPCLLHRVTRRPVVYYGALQPAERDMSAERSGRPGFASIAIQLIGGYLRQLGLLRVVLGLLTLIAVVLAPSGERPLEYEGIGLFLTIILPTLAPLLLSGLLFDMLMSKVVMGDQDDTGKARLRIAIRTDLFLVLLLLLSWSPFFLSIVQ